MYIFKKISAPLITLMIVAYVFRHSNYTSAISLVENSELSKLYTDIEQTATSIIPEKIHQAISVISDFLQKFAAL